MFHLSIIYQQGLYLYVNLESHGIFNFIFQAWKVVSHGKVIYFPRIKRKMIRRVRKPVLITVKKKKIARMLCIIMCKITLNNRLF